MLPQRFNKSLLADFAIDDVDHEIGQVRAVRDR